MSIKNKWIRRIRNSHGYGVQSPNDFYFVQHILHETTPYYRYADLRHLIQNHPTVNQHYTESFLQLLFRLANYIQPQTSVVVGADSILPAYAITLGYPLEHCVLIGPKEMAHGAITDFPQITPMNGDELLLSKEILERPITADLLYIAQTSHYAEITEHALPHMRDKSLLIIEGIHDNPAKHAWWEQLHERHAGICYDLRTIGLLFFDKTRYKNTYWVNLRKHSSL